MPTYVAEVPFYLADDEASLKAAPDRCGPFYVTNLVVPSLAHTYEKDELQCLDTLCGRNSQGKSSQSRCQAKCWHFIWQKSAKLPALTRLW